MREKSIYKIDLSESLTHTLPSGAHPIHVDYQKGNICVWLLVEPDLRPMRRSFLVSGTGWEMPAFIRPDMHIGSCINPGNWNVWHVFDLGYWDALKPYEKKDFELLAYRFDQDDGPDDASAD